MRSAPVRFLNALLWPITIWASLSHLEEHPADDYVERTSPIVAFAVSFWICAAGGVLAWLTLNSGRSFRVAAGDVEHVLRYIDPGLQPVLNVLMVFAPLIYAIGFWMFTARDERYPR